MSNPEHDGESFDAQYQKGMTSVSHRNIGAAGDDHPFGDQAQSFEADLRHLIRKVADDLYDSWEATIREYLANAETACLRVEEYLNNSENSVHDEMLVSKSYQPKIEVEWNKQEDKLTVKDNGVGMAAQEVDEIFRQIGHSAARDDGSKSGQFGMGALSFVKLVGLDNAIIMTSHSRLNDDNAAYYVTLAGVEPIRGSLADDEYGTSFQMTPDSEYDIRMAISTYAEWMRVPVRYEEIGRDGTVAFQEDYGDKALYESYDDNRACLGMRKEDAFEAYASPDANGRTLLLSMDIDRNDGRHSVGQHASPFPFDVRLLDESGKVVESTNGNEGLMPVVDSDYEQMLKESRDPYITREMLNNKDVVAQEVQEGPHAGMMAVDDSRLDGGRPLPSTHEYLPKSELTERDTPGKARVIFGPHKGRVIVSEEAWDEMDEGRASLYVPESELEEYDLDSGTGDLQLPQPTSDRDRLQEHSTFWMYIGQQFAEQFENKVNKVYERLDASDDALETIMELEPEELVVSPAGFDQQS
jgi:hypothetical protein